MVSFYNWPSPPPHPHPKTNSWFRSVVNYVLLIFFFFKLRLMWHYTWHFMWHETNILFYLLVMSSFSLMTMIILTQYQKIKE